MNNLTKILTTSAAFAFGLVSVAQAQNMYSETEDNRESAKFGVTAALNSNFGALGLQSDPANSGLAFVPFERTDGFGLGAYAGLFGEYDSGDWWGVQLRANYDNRFVSVLDDETNPGVTAQYDMSVDYITIEPMFQVKDVFVEDFYLQAGPVVAFNVNTSMDYWADNGGSPDFEDATIEGMQQTVFGVQGGVAYDVELGDSRDGQAWVFTPFVEGSWLTNQRENGLSNVDGDDWDDTWSTPTLRAGIQFASLFTEAQSMEFGEIDVNNVDPVTLAINTPYKGIVKARYVEEDFPLATAVFFEENNNNIPSRYKKLSNSQAKNFTEKSIIAPRELGTHSIEEVNNHQLEVYHNVINIFGDRLRDNPEVNVTLVGGAPLEGDGKKLANSVRDYLVNTFGIDNNRVKVQGRAIPPKASGTNGTPQKDMAMVNDENRKVEFVFSNPFLESPVVMKRMIESPIDHDVIFSLDENEAEVKSWNIFIEGNDKTLSYGPFYGSTVRIDPDVLLADEKDGFYKAKAVVTTENGRTVSEEKSFSLQREVMDETDVMGERFSLLFDYDEYDPENIPFEEFLLTEVIPNIDEDERVIVHGHTDVVGLEDYNYELSLERAQTVQTIIERELKKKDVNAQVDAIGFGESDMRVTFDNSLPEGRYYNRNVIIEIIPNSTMSIK